MNFFLLTNVPCMINGMVNSSACVFIIPTVIVTIDKSTVEDQHDNSFIFLFLRGSINHITSIIC